MNNVDYTPNSHKFKAEQKEAASEKKEVKKVVTGTAKRKKNEVRKFTDVFAPGDMKNIKDYIIWELIVPSGKKMLSEAGRIFLDMLLYGEAGRTRGEHRPYDRISYNDYGRYSSNDRGSAPKTRGVFSYDDIVLPSRTDAENVICYMEDIIATYQIASVADFYEACGISDHNYMNTKYGWTSVRSAKVIPTPDGYMIRMPKASPLN